MNIQVLPFEASSLNDQKMQLEWEAIQLNQQKSNLELAACSLSQRAMEVANMEQAARHETIQRILYLEAEAHRYGQHCEYEMQKQHIF